MDSCIENKSRLCVGIVGAGYISSYHMEILSKLQYVRIAACCDANFSQATALKNSWNIPNAYDNIEDFLQSDNFDVIHVLVPPNYHYSVVKKILEHKVNVVLEKPMAETSQECQELIDIATKNGVVIAVNQNSLFHPLFLKLKQDIENGVIGKVHQVVSFQSGYLGQLDAGMFYHWMLQKPKNVILEQAPHPIAQIRDVLGELKSINATVSGERQLGHNQLFYDRWQAIATCEKGSAVIHMSFGNQYYMQSWLEVSGQDGSIRIDLFKNLYFVQKKSVFPDYLDSIANAMSYSQSVKKGISNFSDYVFSKIGISGKNDAFFLSMKNSIEAFYQSFATGKSIPVSGKDGKDIIEFCEKWAKAARAKENPKVVKKAVKSKTEKAKIFITGATGFIGRSLVEYFVSKKMPVRILVRSANGLPSLFHNPFVEIVQGNIADIDKVEEYVHGTQYVFHLAHSLGQTWEDFERINVMGTRSLAEASIRAGVKYFVFTSTIATYYTGDFKNHKIDENTPIDPKPLRRNFYARSKIVLEKMLMEMYKNQKLPLVMFRPAIVIGKGGMVCHSGIGQWSRDNVCAYWGMGNNKLPFVLVEDVVSALASVVDINGLEGEIFNLAGDVRFSAKRYIEYLKVYSNRDIHAFAYPINICFMSEAFKYLIKSFSGSHKGALLSYRDLSNRSILADFDNSKAKNLLNWKPNSDVKEVVREGIGWAFRKK